MEQTVFSGLRKSGWKVDKHFLKHLECIQGLNSRQVAKDEKSLPPNLASYIDGLERPEGFVLMKDLRISHVRWTTWRRVRKPKGFPLIG